MSAHPVPAPSTSKVAPARDTVVTGGLEVDRTPVTNERYRAFVEASGHRPPVFWPGGRMPDSLVEHPVVGIDLFDALAFARWAGGALPTVDQWLQAAGLEIPTAYVWGDAFDSDRCNTVRSGRCTTTPVHAYLQGAAPSGCLDLCGNVWELTCTPAPDDPEAVIVKGGSWYDYPVHARLDREFRARIHKVGATIGFRLIYVRDPSMPEFLPEDLVERCIAFRRAPAAPAPRRAEGEAEWNEIVDQLRREAVSKVDFDAVACEAEIDGSAIDEVAAFFELAEASTSIPLESLPETRVTPGPRKPRGRPALRPASPARRPRWLVAALFPAGIAAALLAHAVMVGPDRNSFESRPDGALLVPVPDRATPAPGRATLEFHRARSAPLRKALSKLFSQTVSERLAAEDDLLSHPEEAYPLVIEAIERRGAGRGDDSLHYVHAVLREQRSADNPPPEMVSAPPTDGLVAIVTKFDRETADLVTVSRRTAASQGIPYTVVYAGKAREEAVVETFGRMLHGARLHLDAKGEFAREYQIEWPPELVGLDAKGQTLFRHAGSIDRKRMLQYAFRLKRAR